MSARFSLLRRGVVALLLVLGALALSPWPLKLLTASHAQSTTAGSATSATPAAAYRQVYNTSFGSIATPYVFATPRSSSLTSKKDEERRKAEQSRRGKKETPAVTAVHGTPTVKKISKERAAKESGRAQQKYEIPAVNFPPDAIRAVLCFSPLDVIAQQGVDFQVAVVLNNRSRQAADSFQFTVEYDPQWLNFLQYDASTLAPYLGGSESSLRFERKEGRLFFSADLVRPLADEQAVLLKLSFVPRAVFGTASLQFASPPSGLTAVYSRGANLLANTEHGLKGLVGTNVFIRPKQEDEDMATALAESGIEAESDEVPLKGWAESPADARPAAPVFLALQPPEQTSVTLGQTFWVDLVLYNDQLAPIDSIGVTLEFDPQVLQVIDEDEGNWVSEGVNIWDGAFHAAYPFDSFRSNSADNQSGVIEYRVGRYQMPWPFPTGIFARIHFRAVTAAQDTSVRIVRQGRDGNPVTYVNAYGQDRLGLTWKPAEPPKVDLSVVAEARGVR